MPPHGTLSYLHVSCGADHQSIGDEDDALCHSVARILTSLIESKNSNTGIHGYVERNKVRVCPPLRG